MIVTSLHFAALWLCWCWGLCWSRLWTGPPLPATHDFDAATAAHRSASPVPADGRESAKCGQRKPNAVRRPTWRRRQGSLTTSSEANRAIAACSAFLDSCCTLDATQTLWRKVAGPQSESMESRHKFWKRRSASHISAATAPCVWRTARRVAAAQPSDERVAERVWRAPCA